MCASVRDHHDHCVVRKLVVHELKGEVVVLHLSQLVCHRGRLSDEVLVAELVVGLVQQSRRDEFVDDVTEGVSGRLDPRTVLTTV